MKMTGNTILVTGGTSGIGQGLSVRFHEAGNTVIVAGRRKDQLDAIVAEHPGMEAVALDVADPAAIAECHETVTQRHPQLNVLVNMAGIMRREPVLDPASVEVAEATIATNLLGPIRMLGAFLPHLAQQDDAVVVNVSSGLAFVPLPLTPTYSASKAAIHSYTEALRAQLADTGIQVIELVPPLVGTALMGPEQRSNPQAMPLDDYLTEAMSLLRDQPDAAEILVERVKRLRFAQADGTYDEILALHGARR